MDNATTEVEISTIPIPRDVDGLVSRLITDPGELMKLSFRRTTDAQTALSRGLAEYLGQQSILWEGGRLCRFNGVQHTWAEPEDPAEYPVLVITELGDGVYDGAGMTPILVQTADDTSRWITQVSELAQKFEVTVWSTDPVERMALAAMIEDAFEPNDWMTGIRLELPYYFNTRSTYEKTNIAYRDTANAALRGQRCATFTVNANMAQYRPIGDLNTMKVRTVVLADDSVDPDLD